MNMNSYRTIDGIHGEHGEYIIDSGVIPAKALVDGYTRHVGFTTYNVRIRVTMKDLYGGLVYGWYEPVVVAIDSKTITAYGSMSRLIHRIKRGALSLIPLDQPPVLFEIVE